MTIATADWHDILQVLHETHGIWSPGLTKSAYHQYIWGQVNHPWSRHNYRYVVRRERDKPAASCKLYSLTMTSRGREFHVLGIGAVYTLHEFRSRGLAHQLIDDVIELADNENYDGLLLYSEIEPGFYEEFGFVELGAADFYAYLPRTQSSSDGSIATLLPPPVDEEIVWLARHHRRWLRTQPYGIVRPEVYWRYKLQKERFLNKHSRISWPQLQLLTNEDQSGYMLTEQGGTTIRLLESVGSPSSRQRLWEKLLSRAKDIGASRIRGWESGIADLAPGFSLSQLTPPEQKTEPIQYNERDWGRGMLLALSPELDWWPSVFPCPLLELDLV
ncbi:MAG TPA: GNAT family N-acetyltransferase [Planktothrix sp.]|jgi:GNAT superfamily N-acetyltransferase